MKAQYDVNDLYKIQKSLLKDVYDLAKIYSEDKDVIKTFYSNGKYVECHVNEKYISLDCLSELLQSLVLEEQ